MRGGHCNERFPDPRTEGRARPPGRPRCQAAEGEEAAGRLEAEDRGGFAGKPRP